MNKKNICIYGCGECGIQTYLLLREYGIKINCFGDRDEAKQGYVIDNLFCRPYDQILQMDMEETALIIAIAYGHRICAEFQNIGFKNVIYYKDIFHTMIPNTQIENDVLKMLDITALKILKQNIEILAYQTNIPIDKKRNHMLHILEKGVNGKGNESITS